MAIGPELYHPTPHTQPLEQAILAIRSDTRTRITGNHNLAKKTPEP